MGFCLFSYNLFCWLICLTPGAKPGSRRWRKPQLHAVRHAGEWQRFSYDLENRSPRVYVICWQFLGAAITKRRKTKEPVDKKQYPDYNTTVPNNAFRSTKKYPICFMRQQFKESKQTLLFSCYQNAEKRVTSKRTDPF